MIPQGFGRQRRHNENHVLLAAVAVLLSIAAHVGCMYYFSDWIMGGATTLRRSVQERFDGGRVPPMRVEMSRMACVAASNSGPAMRVKVKSSACALLIASSP